MCIVYTNHVLYTMYIYTYKMFLIHNAAVYAQTPIIKRKRGSCLSRLRTFVLYFAKSCYHIF